MNDTVLMDDALDSITLVITPDMAGLRLDKALATLCPAYSRTRLQGLIDDGECVVNGDVCTTPSRKTEINDMIIISIPPLIDADPQPENIPLDIVFEDDDVLVINKAAGMVVHPAVGHYTGTLVNALLHHCGDSLSGINGVKRPGIVHRLDKDTSGLMMVAKNDRAHHALSEQLQDRSLSRIYLALVLGVPFPPRGRVETLMGRHPNNRLKMAVSVKSGKEAITDYLVRETYHNALSLIECHLQTGRTHQIRVHMDHAGFPLVGDPLYGAPTNKTQSVLKKGKLTEDASVAVLAFPRQALHASEISFIHPTTDDAMHFTTPLPDDFNGLLDSVTESPEE